MVVCIIFANHTHVSVMVRVVVSLLLLRCLSSDGVLLSGSPRRWHVSLHIEAISNLARRTGKVDGNVLGLVAQHCAQTQLAKIHGRDAATDLLDCRLGFLRCCRELEMYRCREPLSTLFSCEID